MPVKIAMMQINSEFSGQWYLPYASGLLESYARQHLPNPENYEFATPIFRRDKVADIVSKLKQADILGATLYSWNEQLTMQSIKRLKQEKPSILVVCGGPQVPRAERPWEIDAFHRTYPFIDLLVHGAGEKPFLQILQTGLNGDRESLLSVSFINARDELVRTAPAADIKDLNEAPDPFLTGAFDELHREHHKNVQWIAGMETNRKCPFACTFCSWPMGKPVLRPIEQVFEMLDNAILKYQAGYVFIFDANFGIFRERDLAIAEHIVELKRKYGLPRSANVQDGKNVEESVYKIRKTLIAGGIDSPAIIALQSIYPPTLKAIKRTNIKTESYKVNQARFASENIPTMTDLILSLPEETLESFKFGVGEVISWGQHDRIHFNNLSMTPDAEMTHRDQRKEHGIETVWIKVENMHGIIGQKEEIQEYEELAIATKTLPKEDWVVMRAFGWMTNFLHMNKLVQIPNVICHTADKTAQGEKPRYDKLIDLFMSDKLDPIKFPLLIQIRNYFIECARKIQRGEGQYSPSPEWLDIFWPSDEYMMIKLVRENDIYQFYAEAEQLLADNIVINRKLLHQAFLLGHSLLKLPFRTGKHILKCDWNILEVYRGVRTGVSVELKSGEHTYHIDWSNDSWNSWEDWYKKVVWWCNRSGNYFLKSNAIATEPVPAGHY